MSKAQHTPGPWEFTGFGASKKEALVEYSDGMIEVYGENKESNARFIAAAPETAAERDKLREVNKELREALEHCLMEHGGYTIRGETERLARAALAKAKGE